MNPSAALEVDEIEDLEGGLGTRYCTVGCQVTHLSDSLFRREQGLVSRTHAASNVCLPLGQTTEKIKIMKRGAAAFQYMVAMKNNIRTIHFIIDVRSGLSA